MRLSKKRLAVLVVALGVLAVCVAAVLDSWQLAVVVLAGLQGASLLVTILRPSSANRQLKALRRQEKALRQISVAVSETTRSVAITNRHIANLDSRLTAAQESTRVELADLADRMRG